MSRFVIVLFVAFFTASAFAQKTEPTEKNPSPATESTARLPVKRVALYKNGVGYFEHSAHVHGNQELNIDFTSAQLNDVLKSLTAVDLGEGHISSVRYNSVAPLDERLRALRLPFGEQITSGDFLLALRGARVEVRSGTAAVTGRLLSVEKQRRSNGKGDFYDATVFSIISDGGEMKNFELGPATSVRLAERDLNDEVGRYLNLVGSSRARDLRRMTISATGTGDREIAVSYISEVPVWKSTYRIILSEKPNVKPLLQGWAIVDNTVGEDWKDVQLSLIAGSPQSFIQQISQPYYTRRPVVELPASVMLTPQSHEGTLEGSGSGGSIGTGSGSGVGPGVGGGIGGGSFVRLEQFAKLNAPPGMTGSVSGRATDPSGGPVPTAQVMLRNLQSGTSQSTTANAQGLYQFYSLPAGNYVLTVNANGFNPFSSRLVVSPGTISTADAPLRVGTVSQMVEVEAGRADTFEAAAKQHVEAEGKDLGDYFEYNIKQPITIGKNQSALVPILQARIDAEKVSIWNENSKEIRRALWMTNSSGQTLDSGTFNIVEGNTFAGEGLLDTIHPDERRLISYAADPALRITMDEESSEKPATHVRIAKGIMVLAREQRESRTYTLHNSDTQPRQVVIEHPAREGWKLAEGAKPEESSPSFLRFRVAVGPGKTEPLKIEEYHPEESQYELSNLDSDQVLLITQQQKISPAVSDILKRVLDQKNRVEALQTQINSRQKEIDAITKDQARVRENMKALKGSPEEKALLQRYTHQLDSQEDRLNTLSKEISDLQEKHTQEDAKLDQMIQEISMDENL